jgi:hypothetical protein
MCTLAPATQRPSQMGAHPLPRAARSVPWAGRLAHGRYEKGTRCKGSIGSLTISCHEAASAGVRVVCRIGS